MLQYLWKQNITLSIDFILFHSHSIIGEFIKICSYLHYLLTFWNAGDGDKPHIQFSDICSFFSFLMVLWRQVSTIFHPPLEFIIFS